VICQILVMLFCLYLFLAATSWCMDHQQGKKNPSRRRVSVTADDVEIILGSQRDSFRGDHSQDSLMMTRDGNKLRPQRKSSALSDTEDVMILKHNVLGSRKRDSLGVPKLERDCTEATLTLSAVGSDNNLDRRHSGTSFCSQSSSPMPGSPIPKSPVKKKKGKFCDVQKRLHSFLNLFFVFSEEFSRFARLNIFFFRVLLLFAICALFTRPDLKKNNSSDDDEIELNPIKAVISALSSCMIKIPLMILVTWLMSGKTLKNLEKNWQKGTIRVTTWIALVVLDLLCLYIVLVFTAFYGAGTTNQCLMTFAFALINDLVIFEYFKVLVAFIVFERSGIISKGGHCRSVALKILTVFVLQLAG